MSVEVYLSDPAVTYPRRRPRRVLRRERLKAQAGGYFWLPCPICGGEFGGHEMGRGGWLLHSASESSSTCPQCPGWWIERRGRYLEVQPGLDQSGELYVRVLSGSSAWAVPDPAPGRYA
jgi:hypothetical protein